MATKICACCGQPFQPRPQVPKQTYCSSPACQRERRQAWQRQKLQDDRFYRENLQDAQRAWRDRNPSYSRNYRAANPKYVEKNRNQQRSKPPLTRKSDLAKMDASTWHNHRSIPGFYFGDKVSDPSAELAKDRSELFLTPAAQGFDRQTPAACQFVLVKSDAMRIVPDGWSAKLPARLMGVDLIFHLRRTFRLSGYIAIENLMVLGFDESDFGLHATFR